MFSQRLKGNMDNFSCIEIRRNLLLLVSIYAFSYKFYLLSDDLFFRLVHVLEKRDDH